LDVGHPITPKYKARRRDPKISPRRFLFLQELELGWVRMNPLTFSAIDIAGQGLI
jgi:hypothetical protein